MCGLHFVLHFGHGYLTNSDTFNRSGLPLHHYAQMVLLPPLTF